MDRPTQRQPLLKWSAPLVAAVMLCIALLPGRVHAQCPGPEGISVASLEQTAEKRVSRYEFDYSYRLSIQSTGAVPCRGVAIASSSSATTVVVDGRASFDLVSAGAPVSSIDTFTIRQDRRVPFDPTALHWSIIAGEVGELVAFSPPPIPDLTDPALPRRLPNGNLLLGVAAGGNLQIDPGLNDPITASAGCLSVISKCLDERPNEFDDCARSVPRCTTDRPWEEAGFCCPSGCYAYFNGLRLAGTSPYDAYFEVYLDSPACYPGVSEMIGEE